MNPRLKTLAYSFSEEDLYENKQGRISLKQHNYFNKIGFFMLIFFLLIGLTVGGSLYLCKLSSFLFSTLVLFLFLGIGFILIYNYRINKNSTIRILEGNVHFYTSQINFTSTKNVTGIVINNQKFAIDKNLFIEGEKYILYIVNQYFILSWEKVEDIN